MATITEHKESRKLTINGASSSYTQVFTAIGYAEPGLAGRAVRQALSRFIVVDGYILNAPRNVQVTPLSTQDSSGKGKDAWRVTCTYTHKDTDEDNQEEEERTQQEQEERDEDEGEDSPYSHEAIRIGTGTDFKIYAIDTIDAQTTLVNDFAGNAQPTPIGGFADSDQINMDEFGKIQGLDVAAPTTSFTITKTFSPGFVKRNKKNWMDWVGMVNKTKWRKLEPRCVMLTGVDADQKVNNDTGKNEWRVTFTFEYKKPSTFKLVGDERADHQSVVINNIAGFDYTWVQSIKKTVNKVEINSPVKVYTQQIYEELEFKKLKV